jgi:hypothetical protein
MAAQVKNSGPHNKKTCLLIYAVIHTGRRGEYLKGQQDYKKKIERFLPGVEKPARYTGGEWNSVVKEWDPGKVKIAFAFPDVYEVGMSHLGLQVLYHTVNRRADALMERCFCPVDGYGEYTPHAPFTSIGPGVRQARS